MQRDNSNIDLHSVISTDIENDEGQNTPTLDDFAHPSLSTTRSRDSAFYDYTADKSLSLADSKLFYQRHQIEQRASAEFSCPSERFRSWLPASSTGETPRESTSQLRGDELDLPKELPSRSIDEHMTGNGLPQDGSTTAVFRETSAEALYNNPEAAGEVDWGKFSSANVKSRDVPEPIPLAPSKVYREATDHQFVAAHGTSLGSGERVTTELSLIYTNIQKILDIRHKYMRLSLQESGANPKDEPSWSIYPPPPEPAWNGDSTNNFGSQSDPGSGTNGRVPGDLHPQPYENPQPRPSTFARKGRKPGQDIGEDFEFSDILPLPDESEMTFELDESGVFQVYENNKSAEMEAPILAIPTIRDFYMDLDTILQISSEGPTKSFAFRRLQFLEGKFNLYFLLNEYQEIADSKRVPHRDFYNVRKVDTHVHHSSCMNQKHLLRFIKSKMKKCPNEVVMFRDGKHLTLTEVFESINLTAYDLSIDTLDMHVRFAPKYLPKKQHLLNFLSRHTLIRSTDSTSST